MSDDAGTESTGASSPEQAAGHRHGPLSDRILGARREFTSHDIAAAAGVPVYRARRFWRALGLTDIGDDGPQFTAADSEALRRLLLLISDHIVDEHRALHITRSLGGSTARAARAFTEAALDDMERLLVYSWRRHVVAALPVLQRRGPHSNIAVGFADLVSFTRVSRQLSEQELTGFVTRFEERSSNIITSHGGRVVKFLGDEIFFVADSPVSAATIAHQIAETVRRRRVPGIRIGVEYGPVITHGGDLFGDTVNLASRLTALAAPNEIVIGPRLAGILAESPKFEIDALPATPVKGFGVVTPAALRRVHTRPSDRDVAP